MSVSFWSDRSTPGRRSTADVVVIGGGVSGLSTALALRAADPRLGVTLVERSRVGDGASGRNAGMVLPLLAVPWLIEGALPSSDAAWGWAELRRRWDQLIVDLASAGATVGGADFVLAAPNRAAEAGLDWLSGALTATGSGGTWLDRDELADRTGEAARAGLALPAARVDPRQLCESLHTTARQTGVVVREHTLVTGIHPRVSGIEIATAGGESILAGHAVVAAGAWNTGLHPELAVGRVHQTFALVTEPLDPARLARLGGEDVLVGTAGTGFAYRRVIGDRLLFGGIDDRVAAPLDGVPPEIEQRLLAMMRSSLPWLGDVTVDRLWGGPIHSASMLELPVLRASEADARVVLVGGMAGAGLSWGLLAGALVVGLVRPGLDDPDAARLRRCLDATQIPWVGGATAAWSVARRLLVRS